MVAPPGVDAEWDETNLIFSLARLQEMHIQVSSSNDTNRLWNLFTNVPVLYYSYVTSARASLKL